MPSVLAQVPKERDWFSTPDAIIQSTEDLAQLVLTAAELPPTTALWLRTGWPQGWQRVSSLAKVPPGDLVVKAVMGQSAHRSGGHVCCIARLDGCTTVIASPLHVREISVGCGRAGPDVV